MNQHSLIILKRRGKKGKANKKKQENFNNSQENLLLF